MRVVHEGTLLHELADRPEPPVLQLAHVEVPLGSRVLRPSQKDVARRLHDMLAFDAPLARVTLEFSPEAFEHGCSRLLDLKEEGSAVAAREQADRAERANASDPDRLERYVIERVAIEQVQPLRRKPLLVGGEHAFGVDAMPRVVVAREMIDQRRLVYDAGLSTRYEMREVVVLPKPFARFCEDGMQALSERAILDLSDFSQQLNPAVPDFQW